MKFQKRPVHLLGPNYILDRCSFPFPLESSSWPFDLRSYKWHPRVMVRVSDWVDGERGSFDLIRGRRNERLRVGSIGIRKFLLLVQSRPLIPTFTEPQLEEQGEKEKTENPLNKRIQCCQFVSIHHPSTVNTYRIVFTFYFSLTMHDNDWLLSKLI